MDDGKQTPSDVAQPTLPTVADLAGKLNKPITDVLVKAFAGLELDPKNKKHQKLFLQAATSIVAQYASDTGVVSPRSIDKYASKGASFVARQLHSKLELTKPTLTAVPDLDDSEGEADDDFDNKAED